mmetsp:Transcript_9393/g.16657  ORF Transcript_9393/g.16657 Transcript_9393/m.16657 type:complete len:84 (+) Transcript_9393:30-281(+)
MERKHGLSVTVTAALSSCVGPSPWKRLGAGKEPRCPLPVAGLSGGSRCPAEWDDDLCFPPNAVLHRPQRPCHVEQWDAQRAVL